MRIKIVGLGTVRFKARVKPPKVITAEVRPALRAMSSGAVFGENYTPGTYVSTGGTVVSQTPTYLVNEQVRDENHVAITGQTLRVAVLVLDDSGNFKVFSTLALPVVAAAGSPSILGTPLTGQTVTAVDFAFAGVAPFTYEYRWLRNGADIPGATAASYNLAAADAARNITVGVRARDSQSTLSEWKYSEAIAVDYAVPSYSVQPAFNSASYAQGALVTLTVGVASPAVAFSIIEFTLNGNDKRTSLVEVTPTTFTFDTTGQVAGLLTFKTRATNPSAAVDSLPVTAALTVGVAAVPGQFGADGWSVANQGDGGKARFTLTTLPSNGGSAPTAIQYQIGAAAFVTSGLLAPGFFDVAGFTNGVATDTTVRMVNSAGNGAAAVIKSVTVSDITAPETLPLVYDTPTNAVTVRSSEAAKKYYLVNAAATPLTGAAIKAAVGAATPLVFGSINIGVTEVTPAMGGLSAGIYWLHIASEDAAVNVEAVGEVIEFEWTGAADVTAPVLSLPTGTANGSTASNGTVTTANDANGTLYAIDSTSATPATSTQIRAGQMHTGAPAAGVSAAQAVSATGLQNVAIPTTPSSSALYRQYVHVDAASNISNIAVSAVFNTPAPPASGVALVSSTLMISTTSSAFSFSSATSHTVTSASNRVVLLMIHGTSDVAAAYGAITCEFGGVSATLVQAPAGSGATRDWVAVAIVIAPTSGAKTCTVTSTTNQRALSVRAVELSGVNQTTAVTANGTVDPPTSSDVTLGFNQTTANNGNMLVSTITLNRGGLGAVITVSDGATLIAAAETGTSLSSDHSAATAYEAAPAAGANGHTFNWTPATTGILAWLEMGAA